MSRQLSRLLHQTIDAEFPELRNLTDQEASEKPDGPDSWSPKEELGHLIDSAANNHIRFVRAALEGEFRGPAYAQNDWVRIHAYREASWEEIVDLWYRYNSLITTLVERIPPERLESRCVIGDADAVTLAFLIDDYILHMQHHIDHLLKRKQITVYPSATVTARQDAGRVTS
jgi:hypothetical protein